MSVVSDHMKTKREWLCDIPAHWDIRRNGRIFRETKLVGKEGLPILTVSLHDGVTVRDMDDDKRKQIIEDKTKYKRVSHGDLAYNMMRMWQGAVGIAPVDGLVSPAYVTARPVPEINAKYFEYLYRTPIYMGEVEGYSRGIVSDRNRLYWEGFNQIPTPVPPHAEQDAIVAFLDRKLEEIDRFIANKRRLIELLENERKAIRIKAVTRGISTSPKLKESGIFWLPEIPTKWAPGRIKSAFHNLNTRRIPLNSSDRGTMKSREFDYYGASGVIDKVDHYIFDEPLILVAEDGANLVLRNLRLSIVASGKYWVNNHAHILKPKQGNLFFLAELLEAIDYNPWISGAAQPKLTKDRLMAIEIPIPPRDEQDAIAEWLQSEFSRLDDTVSLIEQEISLMNEFRTSLITEAVTGQIQVTG